MVFIQNCLKKDWLGEEEHGLPDSVGGSFGFCDMCPFRICCDWALGRFLNPTSNDNTEKYCLSDVLTGS